MFDYRFSTAVMPDDEEAAYLKWQDLCEEEINGEACYYRLSNPEASPCRFQHEQMKGVGVIATQAAFNVIVKPLQDDPTTDHTDNT